MSNTDSSALAVRLKWLQGELVQRRSSLRDSGAIGVALGRRTRQLCNELRATIGTGRTRRHGRRPAHDANGAVHGSAPFRPDPARGAADARLPNEPRAVLPPARLRRVIAYIDAHLGEPVRVRDLAGFVGMSPSHFTALFRHSTGLSPHAYVLQRRMCGARELLADRALTLAEIACRLGFSSQAHFTTAFRKCFGITPSVCRARGPGALAAAAKSFPRIIGAF